MVVLCNAAPANPAGLARGVIDVLVGSKLAGPTPPVRPALTLTAEQLAPFAGVYANPLTGAPQLITLGQDTLVLGRGPGAAVLIPLTANRFKVMGQPVELEFRGDSAVQYTTAWPPRSPLAARKVAAAPVQRTKAELEPYAGTYYSEELGASYVVTASDSALVLKTRGGVDRRVQPVYGDTFAGDYLLRFTRKGGRIDGMLMSSGRVRGVRFERTQPK